MTLTRLDILLSRQRCAERRLQAWANFYHYGNEKYRISAERHHALFCMYNAWAHMDGYGKYTYE